MRRPWVAVAARLASLAGLAIHDLVQRRHALLRNFPVIGHGRYLVEAIGPELRQYIVAGNDEERPFSRDQRRWVYASSKLENNFFGFGTDNDIEHTFEYPIVKHAMFGPAVPPSAPAAAQEACLPCAKILGGARGRRAAFRPASVVNISGMSFGSLSGKAIEALNRGAALADCLQNTGEGGLSVHHRHGGELVFQIGTAYFGCRDEIGRFELSKLKDLVAGAPVRALEIKLSQGAKPGLGGLLPAAKVSPESAVGDLGFWGTLADLMAATGRGPDFVNIDGGEGGTGAAPLIFADSVALPFRRGFSRVYSVFARRNLQHDVVFVGAGKLGLPDNAVVALALGCDMVNVGREAMLAVGCIQAQKCHTDRCPTGVATQNRWLTRGLDPALKSVRAANYIKTLRRDLLKVSEACGVLHPGLLTPDMIEFLRPGQGSVTLRELYGYAPDWSVPSPEDHEEISRLMLATAPQGGSALPSPTAQSE